MTRTVRTVAVVLLGLGAVGAIGCSSSRPGLQSDFQQVNNNNSWPERNGYLSRQAVLHPFETQMNNAKVGNDVLMNGYFEAGGEKLNPVGRDKLDQLARKMPAPNSTIYLQSSNDVAYDEKAPEKAIAARSDLDNKRAQAVLAYLSTRPSARGTNFEVQPVDIGEAAMNSAGPSASVRGLPAQYRSTLAGQAGAVTLTGTGGGLATNTQGVNPNQPAAPTAPTAPTPAR